MIFKKITLCNISLVVFVFLFLYFFSLYFMDSTFFNQKDIESYKDDFLLQTLSLAVFFVFITFIYSLYHFYKKSYEKNVTNVKKEIKKVNDKFLSSLTYDLLTNLSNKKYFLERLDEEIGRAHV